MAWRRCTTWSAPALCLLALCHSAVSPVHGAIGSFDPFAKFALDAVADARVPGLSGADLPHNAKIFSGSATHAARTPGRALLQESPERIKLEDLCAGVDVSQPFSCVVGDRMVTKDDVLEIAYVVPQSLAGQALELRLDAISGDPDLLVRKLDSMGGYDMSFGFSSTKGAGEELVYVPAHTIEAGDALIVHVFTTSHTAEFELTIESVGEARTLHPQDLDALLTVRDACCAETGCRAELSTVTSEGASNGCNVRSWHCTEEGHLTHLYLDHFGLRCPASALAPLGTLPALSHLDIAYNQITGDVIDLFAVFDDASLNATKPSSGLTSLYATNVGVTGALPDTCAPGSVLNRLHTLELSLTQVSGSVPACLMHTAEVVSLHSNEMSGALPPVPKHSRLRYLDVSQTGEGALGQSVPVLTGSNLDFSNAVDLDGLHLGYNAFTGTLTVGSNLQIIAAGNNQFTGLKTSDFSELGLLHMESNRLAGALPTEVANAPHLQQLWLADNALTSLPAEWSTPRLELAIFADNQIQGSLPVSLLNQPNLIHVDLQNNQLSGDLSEVSGQLASSAASLAWLEINRNHLSGPIDALLDTGVFNATLQVFINTDQGYYLLPHALNVSYNTLEGEVPVNSMLDVIEASHADNSLLSRAQVHNDIAVDVRENPNMSCPSEDDVDVDLDAWVRFHLIGCGAAGHISVNGNSDASDDSNATGSIGIEHSSSSGKSSGLASGAIVGIVLGVLAGVVAVSVGVVLWLQRHSGATDSSRQFGNFTNFDEMAEAGAAGAANADKRLPLDISMVPTTGTDDGIQTKAAAHGPGPAEQ